MKFFLQTLQLAAFVTLLSTCTAAPKTPSASINNEAETQLNSFCAEVEKVSALNVDPAEKAAKLADFLSSKITHPDLIAGFQALASVDPSQKYKILVQLSQEVGVKNWTCPAYESYSR